MPINASKLVSEKKVRIHPKSEELLRQLKSAKCAKRQGDGRQENNAV